MKSESNMKNKQIKTSKNKNINKYRIKQIKTKRKQMEK